MKKEDFIEILQTPLHLLHTNQSRVNLISNFISKYPYTTSIQYIRLANHILNNKKANNTKLFSEQLSIYKSDPILFINFFKTIENRKNEIVNQFKNKHKEDILELINEIPNSNPLNNPNPKKEDKTEIKEEPIPTPAPKQKEVNAKNLMVMMSFSDWLNHFKIKAEQEKQEKQEKNALKTAWKKEKLTAISDEESEDIPDEIFKQAMDSITETTVISESMAIILAKQGKLDKAIELYKKLSLKNPQKNSYFADRILELKKKKDI